MLDYIHSDVYFSQNRIIIPNHGYVLISDIGSTDDTALLCHTNRPPPSGQSNSGGDWFAPDNTRVNNNDVPGVSRNRGDMVVRLYRTRSGTPPEGLYHCQIRDDTDTTQTVYVGLYSEEQGYYNK